VIRTATYQRITQGISMDVVRCALAQAIKRSVWFDLLGDRQGLAAPAD